jgi:hypothetical protein
MKGSSTPKTPPSTPLLEGSQNAAHQHAVQLMALLKDVAEPKQVMSTDDIQQLMDLSELQIDQAAKLFATRSRFWEEYESNRFTLYQLLASAFVNNSTQSGDPRDRVISLLGLASDDAELQIRPNYTTSCAILYTQAARAIIGSGHVDLLSFSQFPKGEERENLPSWVPDWTGRIYLPPLQLPWDSLFDASKSNSIAGILDDSDRSWKFLRLRGCMVDVVDFVEHSLECYVLNTAETSLPWATTDRDEFMSILKNPLGVSSYIDGIIKLWKRAIASVEASGLTVHRNSLTAWDLEYALIPIADQELFGIGSTRRATMQSVEDYKTMVQELADAAREGRTPNNAAEKVAYFIMMTRQKEQCPFTTTKGYAGLGPDTMRDGDVVVVFAGAKFPYILRKADHEPETWTFVGYAYVHGIMYGELMEQELTFRDFVLV